MIQAVKETKEFESPYVEGLFRSFFNRFKGKKITPNRSLFFQYHNNLLDTRRPFEMVRLVPSRDWSRTTVVCELWDGKLASIDMHSVMSAIDGKWGELYQNSYYRSPGGEDEVFEAIDWGIEARRKENIGNICKSFFERFRGKNIKLDNSLLYGLTRIYPDTEFSDHFEMVRLIDDGYFDRVYCEFTNGEMVIFTIPSVMKCVGGSWYDKFKVITGIDTTSIEVYEDVEYDNKTFLFYKRFFDRFKSVDIAIDYQILQDFVASSISEFGKGQEIVAKMVRQHGQSHVLCKVRSVGGKEINLVVWFPILIRSVGGGWYRKYLNLERSFVEPETFESLIRETTT